MEDAAQAGELVEDGEHVGEGIPGVQDYGLGQLQAQSQHLAEGTLLLRGAHTMVLGEVVVEADLPHRRHLRRLCQPAQCAQPLPAERLTGRVWMPADGRPQTRNPLGEIQAGLVVTIVVPDGEHCHHPGIPCGQQGPLRCHRRGQVQEVRVRVDQGRDGSGFSILGKSGLSSVVWVRGASLPHSRAVAQGALRSALTWAAILAPASGMKGDTR